MWATRKMKQRNVVLYTRKGCHLCEDVYRLLVRHGLEPETVDIDADDDLLAKFNECVPVVFIDGKERFRGQVNETLLRRLLNAKR